MADIAKLDISGRCQWRGVVRGSITRLGDKLSELETKGRLSPVDWLTMKRLQQQLGKVHEDFKRLHFTIVDLLEQREDLEEEQAIVDEHEDRR